MDCLDRMVSVVGNYSALQCRQMHLRDFLYDNTHKDEAEAIAQATDKYERDIRKSRLPAAMISCNSLSRNADAEKIYTRMICLDFDNKDNPCVKDWLHFILNILTQFYCISFAGLSISGRGAFAIIPVATDNHITHFKALQEDFERCGIYIDKSKSNATALRGYAYNNNATSFHNQNAVEYSRQVFSAPPKPFKKPTGNDAIKVQAVVNRIMNEKKDVTKNYADWIRIGQALAVSFDESGRDWFHQLSKFHPEYNFEFANKKYDSFLNKGYDQIGLGTFFILTK